MARTNAQPNPEVHAPASRRRARRSKRECAPGRLDLGGEIRTVSARSLGDTEARVELFAQLARRSLGRAALVFGQRGITR
jgi:hypothetical protein